MPDMPWHGVASMSLRGKVWLTLPSHRSLAPKTQHWEKFVTVIVLNDITNGLYSSDVLIWCTSGVIVVQRIAVTWVPIRCSEVNSNYEFEFCFILNVVKKCWSCLNPYIMKDQLTRIL